jgi:tetratricopeptide (TPR) repeat protein
MFNNRPARILLSVIGILILAVAVYNIPFVNEKLSWRLDNLRVQIIYFFRPPDEAVFVPEEANLEAATLPAPQVIKITPTSSASATPTLPGPTATATATPTPLPGAFTIPGIKYVDQHNRWNYCGPANMTMALNFWGWAGNRDDVAKVVKPGIPDPGLDFIQKGKSDKNVMPYELVNFVNEKTEFRALQRFGGNIDLLKRFIAAGFPVLIEKGYYERDYTGKITWMGHYLFVTGYDDAKGGFTVQDAYLIPGKNLLSKYDIFEEGWRGFNYLFMVVYPINREPEVYHLLGEWGDPTWSNQHALDIANEEVKTETGIDSFFAWFNKGTSHIQLDQNDEAARAFDQAFKIYATLGKDDKQRPYRMMWYQTWPYFAYYRTGRYQDVIDLANATFKTIDKPTLEESLYWRGMAELALGDSASAIGDFRSSVYYNSNFGPGLSQLQTMGVTP